MEQQTKRWSFIFVLALSAMFIYSFCMEKKQPAEAMKFSDFISAVEKGVVKSAVVEGVKISGELTSGKLYSTMVNEKFDAGLFFIQHKNVAVEMRVKQDSSIWWNLFIGFAPLILMFYIFYRIFKKAGGGGKDAMAFTKAPAHTPRNDSETTFADVAGIEEVKARLQEVVDYLKNPKRYTRIGARIPKGVLLTGAPGTGKTLLARAVAGEAEALFFFISGSDFVEMFVGVGASRVRNLFEQVRKNRPSILFIDEIDAVGRHRGTGFGGGHDEREQTLNQILIELDGFERNDGIILVAATNRPDILDPALLRPGRFDLKIEVPLPDVRGREEILKIHTKGKPLDETVNLSDVAAGTPGFSGADLENLANEAALSAARCGRNELGADDFSGAKERLMLGEARKLLMSDGEKKMTAYHEAGHALMHFAHSASDPVELISIIPRSRSLGATWSLPKEDRYSLSKEQIIAKVWAMLGGRAAEEIVFGEAKITTGARQDLESATEAVRRMVAEFGMDEKFGLASYNNDRNAPFLGKSFGMGGGASEATKRKIDQLVGKRLGEYYEVAKNILRDNRKILDDLAGFLIEKEQIGKKHIEELFSWRIKPVN